MADSLVARGVCGACRVAGAWAAADWKPGAAAGKWLGARRHERDDGRRVRHSHRDGGM